MKQKQKRYAIDHTKYLSDAEVSQLEKLCLNRLEQAPRDCLMILTALYTGARALELRLIKKSDLNHQTRGVLVRGVKKSNNREVPIPDWLFNHLVRLEGPVLFDVGRTRLKEIWWQYRPVKKGFHSLRHTFAIRQLRKHGRIDVIKKMLGHVSLTNTMVYIDYAYTQNDLRKFVI